MYAVFTIAGSQFTAQEGDVLKVPSLQAEKGSRIDINDVLLIKDKENTLVGTPTVPDAKIEAEVLEIGLGDRIRVFKQKRRTKYRRTTGHRQQYAEIRINKIVV